MEVYIKKILLLVFLNIFYERNKLFFASKKLLYIVSIYFRFFVFLKEKYYGINLSVCFLSS